MITNGNFSNSNGWGCVPEYYAEINVGGLSPTNRVCEIDATSNICQTVSGFTVGSLYKINFRSSRRTLGCSAPTPATITVEVGTALSATHSRSNATFGFSSYSYTFTANATAMDISFSSSAIASSCGLIIDNISLDLVSALPVELLYFTAEPSSGKEALLSWKTASEDNTKDFVISVSEDGTNWKEVRKVPATGTMNAGAFYTLEYPVNAVPLLYFRLVSRDFDGKRELLGIRSVAVNTDDWASSYPNPFHNMLYVKKQGDHSPVLRNSTGRKVNHYCTFEEQGNLVLIHTQNLAPGIYFLDTGEKTERVVRR